MPIDIINEYEETEHYTYNDVKNSELKRIFGTTLTYSVLSKLEDEYYTDLQVWIRFIGDSTHRICILFNNGIVKTLEYQHIHGVNEPRWNLWDSLEGLTESTTQPRRAKWPRPPRHPTNSS